MSAQIRMQSLWLIALAVLVAGCGASSPNAKREALSDRQSLSSEEMDVLTAAGENAEVGNFDPTGLDGGFQPRSSALADRPVPLTPGQVQFPTRQPLVRPSVRQFNSINQAR